MADEAAQPRFCDQCGISLVALNGFHVQRACETCGKDTFVAEPGEGGKGVLVRPGDTFRIPAGAIRISLDPAKATGVMFRPGVRWFVTRLLTADLPKSPDDVDAYVDRLKDRADELLESSELLSDLDLDDEGDAAKAIKRLEENKDTPEWWAFVMLVTSAGAKEAITDGDVRLAVQRATHMQAAFSMLTYHEHLEEQLWTGHRQTQLIYDIASAAGRTPEDAERIRALRPLFEALDEEVLHAWVESGVPIGPKLGVTTIEEPVLQGLANFHLSRFERARNDEARADDRRSIRWTQVIAAAGVGVTAGGLLVGIAQAVW